MSVRTLGKNRWLSVLFPFVIVLGLWELIVDVHLINAALLPSPSMIVRTVYDLLVPELLLLPHLYKSIYRLAIGYALGVLLGIGLGLLMGGNRICYRIFRPIISLIIPVPTIAWVPLLLIFLGTGDAAIIIAIFLGCFFPIVYNTTSGIRGVEKQLVWTSQIMGAGRATVFLKVLLPASLTSIITGLRLAVGYSWRALIGAEMLAATASGVGYMIYAARAFYDIRVMFVGLVIIACGGLIMDRLVMDPMERKTVERWGMVVRREG